MHLTSVEQTRILLDYRHTHEWSPNFSTNRSGIGSVEFYALTVSMLELHMSKCKVVFIPEINFDNVDADVCIAAPYSA